MKAVAENGIPQESSDSRQLTAQAVMTGGSARWMGRHAVYLPEVDSTNNYAKQLARQGAPAGYCVLAGSQTAGRGRLGRHWFSPQGGLTFTVVLRPEINAERVPAFTLYTASAVATAIRRQTSLPASVKWPNDILINGKKVCGILVEMAAAGHTVPWLVVGIGVNVGLSATELPAPLQATATSLAIALGRPVEQLPLLHAILAELEIRYEQWVAGHHETLLAEARQLSDTLGRQVDVTTATGEVISGLALDLAVDSSLRLQLADNTIRSFFAGEVSLRPAGTT